MYMCAHTHKRTHTHASSMKQNHQQTRQLIVLHYLQIQLYLFFSPSPFCFVLFCFLFYILFVLCAKKISLAIINILGNDSIYDVFLLCSVFSFFFFRMLEETRREVLCLLQARIVGITTRARLKYIYISTRAHTSNHTRIYIYKNRASLTR